MCLDHFNEPVLMMFELARLIGFGDDGDDYYLIVKYPKHPSGKIVWHTAVGGYIFLDKLKDQRLTVPSHPTFYGEIWSDLSRLDNMLTLNGVPREEKFIVEVKTGGLYDTNSK